MNCLNCFSFLWPTLQSDCSQSATVPIAQPIHPSKFSSDRKLAKSLFDAVYDGDEHLVGDLLAKHADPNVPFGSFGSTALFAAVKTGHLRLVDFLLRSGADLAVKDAQNRNVFHIARQTGNLPLLELLARYEQ